uniref:Putative ovule protein n=1 Tax=Solanum chacoense TaxID=4108 RepID=A0A0V0HL86_SOLCH
MREKIKIEVRKWIVTTQKIKKERIFWNGVREWLQAQKERELKNESRVSLEEMKKSEASVSEIFTYSNSNLLNSCSSSVFTSFVGD